MSPSIPPLGFHPDAAPCLAEGKLQGAVVGLRAIEWESTSERACESELQTASPLPSRPEVANSEHPPLRYSDEKVANRDTKVWHGATGNGP